MNTPRLGDPGPVARGAIGALRRLHADPGRACALGKQPGLRPTAAHIAAQHAEQGWREQGVAIVGTLALFNTQAHAVGLAVDISYA